jgi:hypothetical protein
MTNDQAETTLRLVRERQAIEARREAEVCAAARSLIEGHIGPDDRIADMANFYSALVRTIRTARWQGETDRSREDVLSLI